MKHIVFHLVLSCIWGLAQAQQHILEKSWNDLEEAAAMQPPQTKSSCVTMTQPAGLEEIIGEFNKSICSPDELHKSSSPVYLPCTKVWGISKIKSSDPSSVEAQRLIEAHSDSHDATPSDYCRQIEENFREALAFQQKDQIDVKIDGSNFQVQTPQGFIGYRYPPNTEEEKEKMAMWMEIANITAKEAKKRIELKIADSEFMLERLIDHQEQMLMHDDKCAIVPSNKKRYEEYKTNYRNLLGRSVSSLKNVAEMLR